MGSYLHANAQVNPSVQALSASSAPSASSGVISVAAGQMVAGASAGAFAAAGVLLVSAGAVVFGSGLLMNKAGKLVVDSFRQAQREIEERELMERLLAKEGTLL